MTVNPAGFQQVFDFGNPKIITAYAKEVVSGGEFVYASGATGVVSSGANSFAATDIEVATDASGAQFLGVAIANTASGATVGVAVEGVFLVTCNGAVTASTPVSCDGNNSVLANGSVAGNLAHQRTIGRAITGGASGGYALVHIN